MGFWGQNICNNVAAFVIPFNIQHDHVFKNLNFDLVTPPHDLGRVYGQTICNHVAAIVVPFNLIYNIEGIMGNIHVK